MVRNGLIITEEEKSHILKMYDIIKDFKRPLEKLMECKFTSDGKYVIFEGRAFSCETGEQVPINEEWTLSDILHTGADVLSAGLDFVIPGSGAVVDTLNAVSYVIEAQFKNAEEKDSLYLMAAITFGFVIIPGPLQSLAIPLKRAIKTGKNFASPIVKEGLKIIGNSIDTLLLNIPTKINQALKSSLAKNILKSWGDKISGFISNFTSRIKQLLGTLTGKAGKEGVEKVGKEVSVIKQLDANPKLLPMSNTPINKNLLPAVVSKSNILSKLDNAVIGNNGVVVANKLGLVPNSQIKLANGTKFKMSSDNIIDIEYEMVSSTIKGASKKATRMSAWDFMKTYILKPSAKLSTTAIPLSTKLILRSFNANGSLNKQELDVLPQLSGVQLQKDLEYLSQSVAEYEGGTGKYTKNTNATTFQNALIKLGYPLPKFGADGKFGPETQAALKKFQLHNNLTSSNGKMDRITARKLAELLKSKSIQGSEEIQNKLNSI